MAQRTSVDGYPPVLNGAALLSEIADVTLLDAPASPSQVRDVLTAGVTRKHVWQPAATGTLGGKVAKAAWYAGFAASVYRQLLKSPDIAMAYDVEAAVLLLGMRPVPSRVLRVVHLHEIPFTPSTKSSVALKASALPFARLLPRADVVVVPDRHRALLLQQEMRLPVTPAVVMNCPRRMERLPESRLVPLLSDRNLATDKIVHYQGAVGRDHGLETVIQSMPQWPDDAVFAIVGGGSSEYVDELQSLARAHGVADRVVFIGRVPYDEVWSYAAGAALGVTLLAPTTQNWLYSAGASNKRFEYMALGLPQVTNDGPGVRELFGEPGVARIANLDDPRDVGQNIARYLEDPGLSAETGARARALHLDRYNYEVQFGPLLESMLNRVDGWRAG